MDDKLLVSSGDNSLNEGLWRTNQNRLKQVIWLNFDTHVCVAVGQ